MFGSSSKQHTATSGAPAYAQPYLTDILADAKKYYQQGQTPYYPSSTVAGMSPETQTGLSGMRDYAMAGNPITSQATNLATNVLKGDYLSSSNPYLTGAIKNYTDPIIENFKTNVAPSIDSQFAGSGRFGSGLYAKARNKAEDTLADSIADATTNMAYRNYADERGRQMGLLNNATALSQIPYMDQQKLVDIGTAREAYDQADINDAVKRFQAEQQHPFQFLSNYANLVNQGTFGSTNTQPIYQDRAGQFLSFLGLLGGLS